MAVEQIGQPVPSPLYRGLPPDDCLELFDLHQRDICHGDPRPRNIIVKDSKYYWIDFLGSHIEQPAGPGDEKLADAAQRKWNDYVVSSKSHRSAPVRSAESSRHVRHDDHNHRLPVVQCVGVRGGVRLADLPAMTICYEPMTEPALKKIEPVVAELRVRACDRCLLRFGDCRSIQSYRVTSSALRQQFLAAGVSPACLLDASAVCDLCLGILQVPEDPSCDHLINRLASSATYGEYEFSDFTLSIGLPPVLDLRNAGVAARLEMRYPGAFPGVVDVKDAVKWVYGAVVRGATGKSFKFQSEFQVDVLATHDETDDEIIQALSPLIRRVLPDASSKRLKHVVVNSRNFAEKALAVMNVSERSTLVPAKTTVAPCVIAITVSRQPVLITGKYRKFCRLLSQSPWVIDNKRKTESSVQELIADQVTAFIKCSDIKFHSAGREDVDVRMLGDGRHFVLEMIDPRRVPSLKELEELCLRINNSTDRIEVHSLSVAPDYAKEFKTLQAGADSKRKSYRAIMWTSAALTDEAVRTLQGSAPIEIQQKTPIRVLHRRSLLSRPRTIYELSITRINKHFAVLDLVAQAGTYIKEFVHGDRGRTTPSVGDILTCQADIVQLDVMDLHTGH